MENSNDTYIKSRENNFLYKNNKKWCNKMWKILTTRTLNLVRIIFYKKIINNKKMV
jgi:hypothetical protein